MNPQDDPRYGPPATATPMVSKIDSKALTVAAIAMGITFALWAVKGALTGSTGWLIVLLMLAAGVGYVFYRRNPQQVRAFEARVAQLRQNATGVKVADNPGAAPPFANPASGVPAYPPPQPPAQFSGVGTVPSSPGTGAAVSAALLIPSLIAYGWVYTSTSFTYAWQPWWVLTGLNLYFVCCVAARAHAGRRFLATLLGLAGTGLSALATNPSGDVSLISMFSSKQYYDGVAYPVLPPPDVLVWISRVPMLAILLFVASWGIARRQRQGWVLGLIPAGLLVWWAIYGAEHSSGWRECGQGGWFQPWVITVGTFVGGCLCCWLAELLTASGAANAAAQRYAPPVWNGPLGPPETPPAPPIRTQPPAHADYRAQAARHFQGHPANPYEPPR
ncbi:hypothetical protein GWR20_17560 [Mycolicibacter kumamotonensis]|uniref:Uncharacterized protein n=2 Tax=Mycolicibacter kumamotonensis TaxID=354243 RepID=A0A7K3LF30_9MYCO|nr:hypothetical protein [Mycolicibacter kumamotonensis]